MFKKLKRKLKIIRCHHYLTATTFKDLHTGGDGEIYCRGVITCKCGFRGSFAARLPDETAEAIHENMAYGHQPR